MCISSKTCKMMFAALVISLPNVAISQETGAGISVKGRSTPNSGIEQLSNFCLLRADAVTSKELYDQFPELAGMIESALSRNFKAKGFVAASPGDCQLEMQYAVIVKEQGQLSNKKYTNPARENAADGKGKLRVGSISLNAFTRPQNRKVWVGKATNTEGVYIDLNRSADADVAGIRQRVNIAVDKLFLRFPARAK